MCRNGLRDKRTRTPAALSQWYGTERPYRGICRRRSGLNSLFARHRRFYPLCLFQAFPLLPTSFSSLPEEHLPEPNKISNRVPFFHRFPFPGLIVHPVDILISTRQPKTLFDKFELNTEQSDCVTVFGPPFPEGIIHAHSAKLSGKTADRLIS